MGVVYSDQFTLGVLLLYGSFLDQSSMPVNREELSLKFLWQLELEYFKLQYSVFVCDIFVCVLEDLNINNNIVESAKKEV